MNKPSRRETLVLAAGALGALGAGRANAQQAEQQSPAQEPAPQADASEKASLRDVQGAERLAGVDYTPEERQQLLGGVDDLLARVQRLRGFEPPNDLAPATVFDPRLKREAYPAQDNEVRLSSRRAGDKPGSKEDIAYAPAWKLSRWMQTGDLTSRELTDIYLERIEAHAGALECFVTVTPEIARRQAAQADRERSEGRVRGPLHGLPFGLKDLADVEGVKASWGAEPFKDRIAEGDAHVYRKLREAGAVMLGKTTLGALAYGDIWFGGKTRNPWNIREGSSGSSAGSASAAAAGLCAFAIGTETLGSIISPSHRCGTAGLRPTFGRVGRSGSMALCWSLDKFGPITRYAEDTALVLAAINGPDEDDPSSLSHGFAYDGRADYSGLRIGYSPAWFEQAAQPEKDALEAARSLGWNLVEISLPDHPYDALINIVEAESAAAFEALTLSGRDDLLTWQDDAAWPNTWRRARFISAVDLLQTDRLRRRVMQDMAGVFDEADVIFGPNFAGSLLLITNATGSPQMTVRAGFVERRTRDINGQEADAGPAYRVPWNVSLWGPLFGEGRLVALGRQLEAALGAADERPDL